MTKTLFIFLLFLLQIQTFAQDKSAEIDKIFSWTNANAPGCVCAIARDGQVVHNKAYGSADLERNVPLNPNSIFDAGSLTKQFVAASALLLVSEGKLSLTDDIRKYIPELPDYGHTITVDNLLTHTSGIRDWTGMLPITAGKEDAMTVILRQQAINFIPGEEWSYSNSGYVLMKEIVARVSGMSFADFTRQRLFEPLGMKWTAYRENMRAVIPNRALAYDKEGSAWRMAILFDNERGGGGILSTASDLLIWNDALTNKKLGAFVSEKMEEPAHLNNGRKLSYARGIFLNTTPGGSPFYWHSGSADGYKSVLGRFPNQGLSIAIMCNSGDGTDRVSFARRIFDLLAQEKEARWDQDPMPPIAADGVDTATLALNSRTGLYFNETTGEVLRLGIMSGRLRIANGPVLVASSKEHFKRWGAELNFMSNDAFEIGFLSKDRFEMKSMEGKKTFYRRAIPYSPSAEQLNAFAGKYESKEIGAVFLVAAEKTGLTISLQHAPDRKLNLQPIDTDTFQVGMMILRFKRDRSGKVVGLDYSNPLLRKVKFIKLTDNNKKA